LAGCGSKNENGGGGGWREFVRGGSWAEGVRKTICEVCVKGRDVSKNRKKSRDNGDLEIIKRIMRKEKEEYNKMKVMDGGNLLE